ncbi:MAG: serine protease [Humibacillus sp.]|nr:serine protease [Humibacillus sp.]MDN5778604.1 serine protease [Humibacillus sp.]
MSAVTVARSVAITTLLCGALVACSGAAPPPPGTPANGLPTTPAPVTVTVTATPSEQSSTTTGTPTTTAPATWPQIAKGAKPAVVRIDVVTCDARWMGSGFVVGKNLVMTANHVAQGASAITVQYADGVTRARVVGLDPTTDSALLRTEDPVTDQPLQLSTKVPDLGESVAVLGFPLQTYELRFTEGSLSGLHEPVTYDGGPEIDAMVTDTAINGGNSGGPALDDTGQVIGLVSGQLLWVAGRDTPAPAQGQGYIIPAAALVKNLDRWRAQPDQPPTSCGNTLDAGGSENPITVDIPSDDPVATDIARSLLVHGEAINTGNYEAAWQVFTSRMHQKLGTVRSWSSGLGTSYWRGISVQKVSGTGDARTARTVLMTEQASANGHQGQTCSIWVLDYGMKRVDGGWLINSVNSPAGAPKPC